MRERADRRAARRCSSTRHTATVPVDSTVSIQPQSVLGLKYLDLHKGTSTHTFADGATLPARRPTSRSSSTMCSRCSTRRRGTRDPAGPGGFGDTLASRGIGAQRHDREPAGAVRYLRPVAQYLSDAEHRADAVLRQRSNTFMGAVAPVAQVNAELFGKMATTFGGDRPQPARSRRRRSRESPVDLAGVDSVAEAQQPLLDRSDHVRAEHDAGDRSRSKTALPVLNPALEQGTQVLGRTPPLNAAFRTTMDALKTLARGPGHERRAERAGRHRRRR